MAGQVDLRHEGDATRLRIGHQVLQFLLGVPATAPTLDRTGAADFHQLGILFDLDAPALVIGQVQVQAVQLEEGHAVDGLLQVLDRQEAAGHIQREATPAIRGHVGDGDVRQLVFRLGLCRQQLAQALHGIQQAGVGAGAQLDVIGHHQPVTLFAQRRVVGQLQADARGRCFIGGDAPPCQCFLQGALRVGCRRVGFQLHRAGQAQFAGLGLHRLRQRHQVHCDGSVF